MIAAFTKHRSSGLTYAQTVLADSPVAFWELAETSGTVASDSTGHGYNGTYTGTYTQGVSSLLPNGQGAALSVGGSGYVTLPSVAALNTLNHPLTIEGWVKPTNAGTAAYIIGLGATNSPGLALSTVTAGCLEFGYVNLVNNAASSGSLASGATYYSVVTVDASGNIKFYINGAAAGTGTTSGSVGSGAGAIGAYPNNLSLYRWAGILQNIAVYNSALTPTQIANHYAAA